MAVKGYFLDNESYSAHDVNRAFSHITTEGVSLFSDSGTVNSDLNDAISFLTTGGVDMYNNESCKVCKSGDAYMVKKGVCFLSDGAFVEVDESGFIINPESGKQNYVYAMHDALKNECTIYVSQSEAPLEAVMLAEIDEEGKITDKRLFAQAKIAVPTTNILAQKTVTLSFPLGNNRNDYNCKEMTCEIGYGGFNFVEAKFEGKTFRAYIADGEEVEFLDGAHRKVWVKKEGTTLVLTMGTWYGSSASTYEVEMSLF